jgi:hypothetical protein
LAGDRCEIGIRFIYFMSSSFAIHLQNLSGVERLFCLALAADPARRAAEMPALYREVGDETLWAFAQREGSASIVAAALRDTLGESGLPRRWSESAKETEALLALYLEQLDRVSTALDEKGIRLVALKNSGIARGIHRDLAGCPMGDIDALVSPREFRRAHEIMKSIGFELGDRSPFEVVDLEEAERHGGTEYTYPLSDGSVLWFELQWRPVAGRWIRPDQEPPADELLARSMPIEGTKARLLAPEDNLLQVCLHTAKHSYVRAPGFRLHTDVDRIVRNCAIDWNAFCTRVEKIGVRTAVYLSLLIPARLLGTPVPQEVLSRLDFAPAKHRRMLRWLSRVGLFGPKERKWSKLGYIGFNLLLYDTLAGAVRAVVPDGDWMVKRYDIKRRWMLPWWYVVRGVELVIKRANT